MMNFLKKISLVCLLFGAAAAVSSNTALRKEFHGLAQLHERAYALGDAEYEARFATYVDNVKRVQELNEKSKSAVFGVKNQFFDMSAEEFKTQVLMTFRDDASDAAAPTPGPVAPQTCLAKGVTQAAATKEAPLSALPKSFDWRDAKNPSVVSPVKNQGACGSCWAFSTIEVIESQWALKNQKDPIELSPQQLVSCSHAGSKDPPHGVVRNAGCDGGWPWAAYTSVQVHGGVDSAAVYPYTAETGTCGFQKSGIVPGTAVQNYTCLSSQTSGAASETHMQQVLHAQGPLSIAADAVSWQFYEFGVITSDLCIGGPNSLDHAIVITGWGTETDLFGQKIPYWAVRNSWGASWGINGYLRLEFGTNTCGVANAVSIPHL